MWRKMGWPVPRRSQHQSDASHISTYGVRISWLCHVIWLYHLISIQYQLHPTAAETNPNYLRWKWMIMLLILSNWDSVGFQTCLILFIQPQSWIHSHGSWLILLGCVKTIRDMLKYDEIWCSHASDIQRDYSNPMTDGPMASSEARFYWFGLRGVDVGGCDDSLKGIREAVCRLRLAKGALC